MTETANILFSRFHQTDLWNIALYLDLDTLQNLVQVVASNKYLKTTLMVIVNIKMQEIREKCRLLLWTPNHFTRHLDILSETNLAHVSLLTTILGDDNRCQVLKFMKNTFTKKEQPVLLYIKQFYDESSPFSKKQNILYKEILDECIYRQYRNIL